MNIKWKEKPCSSAILLFLGWFLNKTLNVIFDYVLHVCFRGNHLEHWQLQQDQQLAGAEESHPTSTSAVLLILTSLKPQWIMSSVYI